MGMDNLSVFLGKILDSMTAHIVVVDDSGEIQFVNNSWTQFGDQNGCNVTGEWLGVNYLEECEKAASMGDDFGKNAAAGIRSVMENHSTAFYFEYPCHSLDEKRWFMMRVTFFEINNLNYYVISHQNITERKAAEEEVKKLSRIDGLTNIPNRRAFDEFLKAEWKRCTRLKKTISLVLVDLDHFKLLNDTYGHQAGDECLVEIGSVLQRYANRPGDICARYGGEEFSIIWSETTLDQSRLLSKELLEKIESLKIDNKLSPLGGVLTASIGLSTMVPKVGGDEAELIKAADSMLYRAKSKGRNQVAG